MQWITMPASLPNIASALRPRDWTALLAAGPQYPKITIEARLLALADRLAAQLGLCDGPFRGEDLVQIAQRRTGLTDFGDTSFREPLDILLRDYDQSADLTVFGRLAARWDVLRFLGNLLILRQREKSCPEILEQRIDRPIFIAGMPRSGSTFLHNLMTLDPAVLTPLCWQTIHPLPLHSRAGKPDRRAALVDRQLSRYFRLVPELKAIHPFSAASPQECSEILAHLFRSRRFETTHQLADYPRWLSQNGDLPGYQFHKRFLQHIQHCHGPRRWILKCPDHTFSIPSIRAVYPDACFVFMHRDPVKVLPSVAMLTKVLRRPFTRHIDMLGIGRQVQESWIHGASLLIQSATTSGADGNRIVNIGYRELIANPPATVRGLYRTFEIPFNDETERRVRRFVAERVNGGYGRLSYSAAEFGFDLREQAALFRDYLDCFGVEREYSDGSDDQVERAPRRISTAPGPA